MALNSKIFATRSRKKGRNVSNIDRKIPLKYSLYARTSIISVCFMSKDPMMLEQFVRTMMSSPNAVDRMPAANEMIEMTMISLTGDLEIKGVSPFSPLSTT